jgi:hypothetical protein
MLSFMVHNRAAWEDHFPGISPTRNIKQKEFTIRPSITEANVFVSYCLFKNCSSTTDGGALSCTSAAYLLIEYSAFISCRISSRYGAAIYFSNTNAGECVLYGVCGTDCCSTNTSYSYGQFAHINVNNDASSKNFLIYSSIVRCVSQSTCIYYTMRLQNGNIYCPSINSSLNHFYHHSGISCYPSSDSNSVTCSLLYSSIVDTIVTGCSCITITQSGAKHEIKCCNILRNKQGSPTCEGTIRVNGHLIIKDSCILENNATYIFYSYSSNSITISNCTVDSTSNNGYLTIQSTATKSFIHTLHHMSTQNCHAEYNSHLTKRVVCYTCKKLQCNLFSLNYLLLSHLFIQPLMVITG